jgi:hypothetical protein
MSDAETAAALSLINDFFASNVSALVKHPVCFLNVYVSSIAQVPLHCLSTGIICSGHCIVAFVTLLCYDYCLTFSREVSQQIDHSTK